MVNQNRRGQCFRRHLGNDPEEPVTERGEHVFEGFKAARNQVKDVGGKRIADALSKALILALLFLEFPLLFRRLPLQTCGVRRRGKTL